MGCTAACHCNVEDALIVVGNIAEECNTLMRFEEGSVAERLRQFAASTPANSPDLCVLEPKAFVEQVINGGVAIDDGDWIQPLFQRKGGVWQLEKFEVLYRVNNAFGVPFPAFVDFVHAATDQGSDADFNLQQEFRKHAVSSMQRVDARLSQLRVEQREAMVEAGLLTSLNFTAKQLDAVLSVPLENANLLGVEETEYDAAPGNLSDVRQQVWQRVGALSLDDVKPTLADVAACAGGSLDYQPPRAPGGKPFKPLQPSYNHDLGFARQFISDFKEARQGNPKATGDVKLDEEFCCYLIGVGHAPFARTVMAQWHAEHPTASAAVRRAGLDIIREALAAGMGICLEVSFEDSDVQWLLDEVPELEGRLSKQGGRCGSAALPHSLLEATLLAEEDPSSL